MALVVIEHRVDHNDRDAVESLVGELDISITNDAVTLNGRDVTKRIRDDDVTATVAAVSAHPGVRQALVECQRAVARDGDVVIEGRDIGSAVLPDAEHKIFLTADATERARRRALQMGLAADGATVARIAAEISARDRADATRTLSPLVQPPDAIVIDSTDMTLDDVVARVVAVVHSAHGR